MTRTFTQGISVLSAALISTGCAQGQYDSLFVGDAEAISVGPFETPFPTGGAVTSRTQYLFYASELMGLLPPNMNVEGLVLDLLDSDPPGTTVDVAINMKNTVTSCMVGLEYTGLQFVADSTLHLDSGTVAFAFDQVYFQWVGGMNVIVEFCMGRNGAPGIDPRVTLDTSFVCDPTYYAHDFESSTCGLLTTFNADIHGPFDSRPVMGFLVETTTPVGSNEGRPARVALYPNPASDRIRLRLLDAPTAITVQLFNSTGRMEGGIMSLMPDAAGFVDLSLPDISAGCYLLKVSDDLGRPIWEQPLIME